MLWDSTSYRDLSKLPRSVSRRSSVSHAATSRTLMGRLVSSPMRLDSMVVREAARARAMSTGIFSISSIKRVPPEASSSLPGWLTSLLMLTPKISCSKSSGVTSPQCSVIKGPVAKGLA